MSNSNFMHLKPLRILATTSGKGKQRLMTNRIFELMPEGSELIITGNKRADYVLGGLSRMRKRRGIAEELIKPGKYFGYDSEQMLSHVLDNPVYMGIDHIQRRGKKFAWKHHPMDRVSDTYHYYHIVYDILSEFIERERIDLVLHFNCPHLFFDTIIYHIAKSKGIRTLMVTHLPFEDIFVSLEVIQHLGFIAENSDDSDVQQFSIDSEAIPNWDYMKGIEQYRGDLGALCWQGVMQFFVNILAAETSKLLDFRFLIQSLNRMRKISAQLPKWRYPFRRYFHSSDFDYYETILKFENDEVNLNCRFVYFPLQLQPEMTTSTFGGRFSDQLLAIEHLAELVPSDCLIFVKENPKQTGRMRDSHYFHRLLRIPNVRYLPSFVNTYELIDHSQFVVTITGTVGWEAISRGKNALVFGICWYRNLTGVFEYNENLNFDDICNHEIDHTKLEFQVGRLLSHAHPGHIWKENEPDVDSIAEIILNLIYRQVPCTFVEN